MSKFHLLYVFHWAARWKRFECSALVTVIAFVAMWCALPANSQSAPWTELDINFPPLAGSFSYNGSASRPPIRWWDRALAVIIARISWRTRMYQLLRILRWRLE